ncbi:caspase family protein [Lentzea sp. NPDC059081]|uniref:caspase family protein n=1 Tax=Lentzea sp. NPDC059081 TaxID=3346719 RepID=UPI0036909ED8
MPEHRYRRTALLIDVTTFGGTDDGFDVPLDQLKALPFSNEVDELATAFKQVGYQVDRITDPASEDMEAKIRAVVRDHGPGDAVVVHIMTHGYTGEVVESLNICGSDSTRDGPSMDMTILLRDFILQKSGPHILFSLDLCYAGKAAELDHVMRVRHPDKVWYVGATSSARAAFDGRFTTALKNTLELIRDGLLETDSRRPYVPFSDFARTVREELDEVVRKSESRTPQTATATLFGGELDVRDLPFFDNRQVSPPPRKEAQDGLAYFVDAANVQFIDGQNHTDFTGRLTEIGTLLTWLRGGATAGPRLVTGRAGTGKSALLGALVCATHPLLAPRTTSITQRIGAAPQIDMMAAVPARHRDVAGLVTMISAQLFGASNIHSPQGLATALRSHREQHPDDPPAVIVVDSLDEATAPAQVFNTLLRTLSELRDTRDQPICEVVIASRSTSEVTDVIRSAATGVVDLDVADPTQLRKDLESYAWNLLSDAAYQINRPDVRGALAGAIADRLVRADPPPAWGEFLIARLYLNHLIESRSVVADVAEATALGEEVPLDAADALELGLAAHGDKPWARPVLAALALVHGLGAPAKVIADLAGLFRKPSHLRPSRYELVQVLKALGSYLRVLPAPDDGDLYRLFHEGLADHLREHPISPTVENPVTALEVCDALILGTHSWATADPYVLRHVLHHARGTEQLPKLLKDRDFLLCGRPEVLLAVAEVAEDTTLGELRSLARAAHAVMVEHEQAPGDLERLAVVAAREGDVLLAEAVSTGTYKPVLVLDLPRPPSTSASPVLLSGANSSSVVQIYGPTSEYCELFQVRHPYPVVSLCASTHHGDELVTGDDKGTARVWPLIEGSIPRLILAGHLGPVRALAAIERDGETPMLLSADDQALRLWSSEDGEKLRTIPSAAQHVIGLVPFSLAGRMHSRVLVQSAPRNYVYNLEADHWDQLPGQAGVTALYPAENGVSALSFSKHGVVASVDLATFAHERWMPSAGGAVTAAAYVPGLRGPVVVSGDSSGRLALWDPGTGGRTDLGEVSGEVTALASFVVNGRPAIVCASADGKVSVWDPAKVERRTRFAVSKNITAFAHDWSPAEEEHRAAPLVRCGWGFEGVVVAMVDVDNTVRVHCSTGDSLTLGPFDRAIAGVSVVTEDDCASVIVEDDRGLARVWHPITGAKLWETAANTVQSTPSLGHSSLFVHDRLVRVEKGDNGEIRLVPLADDDQDVIEFEAHSGPITALAAWRHKGTARAATCGKDGFLRVWDVDSQTLHYQMELSGAATNIVAVRGDHLVVQTDDEVIVLSQRESR